MKRRLGIAPLLIVLPIALLAVFGIFLYKSKYLGVSCSYGSSTYSVGDSFPAEDGCNDCKCGIDGDVRCTLKGCSVPVSTSTTVGWETYTNTQYQYSLKYPREWLTKSFGPGLGAGLQPLSTSSKGVILSPNKQDETVPNPMLEIQVEGPKNLSRPTYAKWKEHTISNFREIYRLTEESTTIIAGTTAAVLEGEHVYPRTTTYVKRLIFTSPEKGVYFSITIASDSEQESSVFDQIFPTFKFTD